MDFNAGQFDIAVIGAGHAGIRSGVGFGAPRDENGLLYHQSGRRRQHAVQPGHRRHGQGHLVRELDALGGEMAKAADKTCIQYRLLNRGKGPAVHSLRAQADRRAYQQLMKHTLETQENLSLKQAEITEIIVENGAVTAVKTQTGATYYCNAAIICTGTYLAGRTIIGDEIHDSGPDGLHASVHLGRNLAALGLEMRRFKTGTPPRINARSVDFSKMEMQPGDKNAAVFV